MESQSLRCLCWHFLEILRRLSQWVARVAAPAPAAAVCGVLPHVMSEGQKGHERHRRRRINAWVEQNIGQVFGVRKYLEKEVGASYCGEGCLFENRIMFEVFISDVA